MKVAVIMGSKSDAEVVKKAVDALRELGIETDTHVMSAHRTPDAVANYARCARDEGVEVIIAAAGKAAHLAGVIAAHTVLPVIGLPIGTSVMGGMDSLLSTVQMPAGIPVATVAIDGGRNAGLLAAEILAVKYPELADKLAAMKADMQKEVEQADRGLEL